MITSIEQVQESRLTWPDSQQRSAFRKAGTFNAPSIDKALQEIKWEMGRWGARDFIVSRNSLRMYAGDPAVALWWVPKKPPAQGPNLRVLACDRYQTQGSNAHAIYLTLDAMRALDRWGCYTMEQASEGARVALPPPATADEIVWRAVLGAVPDGIEKVDALAIVNARYRRMSAEAQGDENEQRRLNLAVEKARQELS